MANPGPSAASGVEFDLDGDSAETSTLYNIIDKDKVFGLNLTVPEDAKELIKPWNERDSLERWVDSGVDDQLIIHVPFIENVKVRSILLKPARGEACPHRLRIYSNIPDGLDFDQAENTKPNLDFSLLENENDVTEYPLRVAAFTSVNSLTLFFGPNLMFNRCLALIPTSEAPGEETSRLYYIGFRGELRAPKKDNTSRLDIPAANAADAPVDRLAEKSSSSHTTIR
ncbi:DUF1000-domain-containing protein [Clavulina sp. PMI_390]|nr:DUF1000-domain-containing protein [Clavulina sp. PMI_390]